MAMVVFRGCGWQQPTGRLTAQVNWLGVWELATTWHIHQVNHLAMAMSHN